MDGIDDDCRELPYRMQTHRKPLQGNNYKELPKLNVAGSIPAARSTIFQDCPVLIWGVAVGRGWDGTAKDAKRGGADK
jgi:hypothetical protein